MLDALLHPPASRETLRAGTSEPLWRWLHGALAAGMCREAGLLLAQEGRLRALGLSLHSVRSVLRKEGGAAEEATRQRTLAALQATREYAEACAAAGVPLEELIRMAMRLEAVGLSDGAVRVIAALAPFMASGSVERESIHALLHWLIDARRARVALHTARVLLARARLVAPPGAPEPVATPQEAFALVRAYAALPGRDAIALCVEQLREMAARGSWPSVSIYSLLVRLCLETLALESARGARAPAGQPLLHPRWRGEAAGEDPLVAAIVGQGVGQRARDAVESDGDSGGGDGGGEGSHVIWVSEDESGSDDGSEGESLLVRAAASGGGSGRRQAALQVRAGAGDAAACDAAPTEPGGEEDDGEIDPLHRALALYDSFTGSLQEHQSSTAAAINAALVTGALRLSDASVRAWEAAGGAPGAVPPLVHVGLAALARVTAWHASRMAGPWGAAGRGGSVDGGDGGIAAHGAHAWHAQHLALESAAAAGARGVAAGDALAAARGALVHRATALRTPFPGARACALALMEAMGRAGWAPAHIRAIYRWLAAVVPAHLAATEEGDQGLADALAASTKARRRGRNVSQEGS